MSYRPLSTRTRAHKRPRLGFGLVIFLVLCTLANGVLIIAYHDRELPRTYLGQLDVSNKSVASLQGVRSNDVLPKTLTFQYGSTTHTLTSAALGLKVDAAASLKTTSVWRRWLPLLSLFRKETLPVYVNTNSTTYAAAVATLSEIFSRTAQPTHVVFDGSSFVISAAQGGYALNTTKLTTLLPSAIRQGAHTITVSVSTSPAPSSTVNLTEAVQTLQRQLDTKVTFAYQGHSVAPSKQDIGGWYTASGQSMSPSSARIAAYVTNLGSRFNITIANPEDLAVGTSYALSKELARNFALVPKNSSTLLRTYCTAVRDVTGSVIDELSGKLAATYNDTRGWNDGGMIAFEHVDTGCQYTVWLSAASDMTDFGAICDDYYNCQVGTNVILNYDRWTSATPPWNSTHGSIEDYRTLMIDHETGHRLGFLDNPTCSGAGQPAPVMMQQSIDLKGCAFNIWPLASEFSHLNSSLGLNPIAASSD